ncbi:lasso RiPP family leader peptide-containing protein [Lysinibacillus xylanilyticus]
MTDVVYSKPTIEKVASFKESTKGLWFGKFIDGLGSRAFIHIEIG